LGGDIRVLSVALQEARIVVSRGGTERTLLANLATIQPFSALLSLAQLRLN
jgi:hypothetical protein